MPCPAPTHDHISSGCNGPVGSPEMCSTKHTTNELCATESNHINPSKHQKGSINNGGGGGGGGSGCGKPSPCTPSKKCCKSCCKKTKSCGKKKSCGPKKVVLTFLDASGNPINPKDVIKAISGEPFVNPQKVESGGTGDPPWIDCATLLENSPVYFAKYKAAGLKTHYQWTTPDYTNVTECRKVKMQLRDLQADDLPVPFTDENPPPETETVTQIKSINDDVQAFHDNCSVNGIDAVIKDCMDNLESTTLAMTPDSIFPTVTNSSNVVGIRSFKKRDVRVKDPGILDILLEIPVILVDDKEVKGSCTDMPTFENIKKGLLNIKSTFAHRIRMQMNMEIMDAKMEVGKYVNELYVHLADGEKLDDYIVQYQKEIKEILINIFLDNVEALQDYRKSFDKYINLLVSLFPGDTDSMNAIKQKKEDFDLYVDKQLNLDVNKKYSELDTKYTEFVFL